MFGPSEASAEIRDLFVEDPVGGRKSQAGNAKSVIAQLKADDVFKDFSVTRCWKKNVDVIDFLRRALREYPGARVRSAEIWLAFVRENAQLKSAFDQFERDGWVVGDQPLTTHQLLRRIEQGKDGRQIKADVVAGAKKLNLATGAIHRDYLFLVDQERAQDWVARIRARYVSLFSSALEVFGVTERKALEELADRVTLEAFLLGHPHAQRGVLLIEEYLDREKVLEELVTAGKIVPGVSQILDVLRHRDRFSPPTITLARLVDEDDDFNKNATVFNHPFEGRQPREVQQQLQQQLQ